MAAFNARYLTALLEKVQKNEECEIHMSTHLCTQSLKTMSLMSVPLEVAKDLQLESIISPFAEIETLKGSIAVILEKLAAKKEALKKEEEKKAKRNEQARARYAKKTEETRKRKAEETVSAPEAKKSKEDNKENIPPKKVAPVKKLKQTALMRKCMQMRKSIPY